MMISPRIPNVPRKPDAVPGSVKAVETTPIRMLGATNAIAAAAGVRNLGVTPASAWLHLGQSRHDHTEQPELAALQGIGGVDHR
jgi:hypothetical protein